MFTSREAVGSCWELGVPCAQRGKLDSERAGVELILSHLSSDQ